MTSDCIKKLDVITKHSERKKRTPEERKKL
jgi:hypothetical protein